MDGSLGGYRLRSAHGDTIDPRQPLPVDTVEAQETSSVAPTLTYNGKAAAGAISIASVALKPIIENLGSRVGSYWGDIQNKVYSAYADKNPKKTTSWLLSVTETATAAAITIYDPNKNLEEMFESLTGTVKRFVVKVYDKSGGTLYGWVMGVSVSSNVYTFSIMNNRLTETQSWVGTLGDFDNTSLEKVEIYFYNSSVAFGTGTCFTEEVGCPKEYSKNRELQLTYAETLANGQYFIDYMRGELIGVKADATASEVVTYNVWSSTVGGSSGPATNVDIDKVGGVAVPTAGADAVSNTRSDVPTDSRIQGFNGTTWDRIRTGIVGVVTSVVGYLNVMNVGRYNATALTLSDTNYVNAQVDVNGSQQVNQRTLQAGEDLSNNVTAIQQRKLASATYAPLLFTNFGANATLNVKASAGNVFSVSAYNTNAAARFIQLHNTATVPAGAAVPLVSHLVPAGTEVILGEDFFSAAGLNFTTGIAFAMSTTLATYTAATAGEGFVELHYI